MKTKRFEYVQQVVLFTHKETNETMALYIPIDIELNYEKFVEDMARLNPVYEVKLDSLLEFTGTNRGILNQYTHLANNEQLHQLVFDESVPRLISYRILERSRFISRCISIYGG